MKPSNLFVAGLFITLAVTMVGCRKEKVDPQGERLVSARPPLSLTEVRPEDARSQSLLSQKLIASSLTLSGRQHDFVDTLTPTLMLTTLLNASENETSERLIKGMGIFEGRHDRFTKSFQAQLDHLRTEGKGDARWNLALWMIWPILLTPDFQEEMGEKLGVSIYRLGNAGLTSSRRIKDWGSEYSPERKRFDLTLSKQDVTMATSVLMLYPSPETKGLKTTFEGHEVTFYKAGKEIEAVKISGPNSRGLLGRLDLPALRKAAVPVENSTVPPMPTFARQTQQKVLEAAGFGYLFEETNDWRYMAMELRSHSISRWVSFSGSVWRSPVLTDAEPGSLVIIWVPDSGLVLGGGLAMHIGPIGS